MRNGHPVSDNGLCHWLRNLQVARHPCETRAALSALIDLLGAAEATHSGINQFALFLDKKDTHCIPKMHCLQSFRA